MTDEETGDMVISKLYEDGTYKESESYEDIYVIYMEYEESSIATGFVGKHGKEYYLIGDDLCAYEKCNSMMIRTRTSWIDEKDNDREYIMTAYHNVRKMWWLPKDSGEPVYDSGRL